MIQIHEAYEKLIEPHNFIKNFKTEEDFKEWCRLGIINDVRAARDVFERHEMYEVANLAQQVIDEKVDKMLSGLGFDN